MKKTNQTPLISVIMPVYNAGRFLPKAIDSIINQTENNWEMITVNDGSTDNSLSILKKYATSDKRIKILDNGKNVGMAASLNRALGICNGKYIARMDADDVSLPNRFAKQIKLLERNPNLVAVGGQEEIINENNEVVAQKNFPVSPLECYQTLANIMPIQPPTLMVRGNAFRKYRYDPVLCRNDDIDIFFKLLQEGDIGNVNQVIFQYRQLSSSLTHSNAKSVFFMALRIRLQAIFKYGYRPSLARLLILAGETMVVTILPVGSIIKLFKLIRYKGKIIELLPSFNASAPAWDKK